MLLEVITAILCTSVIFWLLWLLGDVLLTRIRTGKNTTLKVYLEVSGAEPHLEETVRALCRLHRSGRLPARLIIVDKGMDEETGTAARLLCRDGVVCLKEEEWTK